MSNQADMNNVLNSLSIDGSCIRAERHRHLAVYDISLASKPSVLARLKRSGDQIALALRSYTPPIMRLVPEEGIVRLQFAMDRAQPILLTDLYCGEIVPMNMIFPMLLGESDEGRKFWMDMNDNPHMLVAGSTGSGKSTLLHTLIANGLMLHALRIRNVWICLSDPKRIEFQEYKDQVLNDIVKIAQAYDETLNQLEAIAALMEQRYAQMSSLGIRNIEENPQALPLVLCIIDEVSDLMLQDKGRKLETMIVKLAQKGRAAGIFLVLATQRPSVDVITGLIKANFPGRIACKTASRKDSEVILDHPGAETLLGRGDAVLQNMRLSGVRFQVAYITPKGVLSMYDQLNSRHS